MSANLPRCSLTDHLEDQSVEVEDLDQTLKLLPPAQLDAYWDEVFNSYLGFKNILDTFHLAQRHCNEVLKSQAGTLGALEEDLEFLDAELLLRKNDLKEVEELINHFRPFHRQHFQ